MATISNAKRRAQRARYKLRKNAEGKVRLSVFRSNKNIYAQLIDDEKGVTIASASTVENGAKVEKASNKAAAASVGEKIAAKAKDAKIETVVFDRGSYRYHGRIKELADAARNAGLKF